MPPLGDLLCSSKLHLDLGDLDEAGALAVEVTHDVVDLVARQAGHRVDEVLQTAHVQLRVLLLLWCHVFLL